MYIYGSKTQWAKECIKHKDADQYAARKYINSENNWPLTNKRINII